MRVALAFSLLVLLSRPALAVVAATDINADLAAADKACLAIEDQIRKTDCFNARERAVWLRDSPESIDSFDLFAARRTQLINQFSTGVITSGEYMQGFRAATRHLVVYKTLTAPLAPR